MTELLDRVKRYAVSLDDRIKSTEKRRYEVQKHSLGVQPDLSKYDQELAVYREIRRAIDVMFPELHNGK